MLLRYIDRYIRKMFCNQVAESTCNWIFRRKMSGIQQIQSDVVRTHHNIIAAVADDKRVCPLGNRFIHHLTAGTTADSDTLHHFSAVCHANTAGIQR